MPKPGQDGIPEYARHRLHMTIGRVKRVTMDGWEMVDCVDMRNGGTYPPPEETAWWSKRNVIPATETEYREQLERANKRNR